MIRNYVALNGAFAIEDPHAYLDGWQSVDSNQGVTVANKAFDNLDLKPIIEMLNTALIA